MKVSAIYSVVFPIKEDDRGNIVAINLSTKTRKIFAGMILGSGGQQDLADNSIYDCGCREFGEELNRRYQIHELEEVGVIVSHEPKGVSQIHYFFARGGKGPIRATKDKGMVKPTWYPLADIPYEKMPVHFPMLLEKFLQGLRVKGTIKIDPKRNVLFAAKIRTFKKTPAPI